MGKVVDETFSELSVGARQQCKSMKLPQEPSAEVSDLGWNVSPRYRGRI